MDQIQDGLNKQAHQQRNDHRHDSADGQGRAHCAVDPLVVLCPAVLGDEHRAAGAGAQADIAGSVADIADVVDRGQSRRADELTHDDGIHGTVQGLQHA